MSWPYSLAGSIECEDAIGRDEIVVQAVNNYILMSRQAQTKLKIAQTKKTICEDLITITNGYKN